jgi:hypothetical protein
MSPHLAMSWLNIMTFVLKQLFRKMKKWQPYSEFPVRVLPERVAFNIESVDQNYQNATQQDLINQQAQINLVW